MSKDFAWVDLEAEIRDSESLKPWSSAKHSKTLVKNDDLRVVLFTMESGATLKEHYANGSITVQVLRGEIRFSAQDHDHSLRTDAYAWTLDQACGRVCRRFCVPPHYFLAPHVNPVAAPVNTSREISFKAFRSVNSATPAYHPSEEGRFSGTMEALPVIASI